MKDRYVRWGSGLLILFGAILLGTASPAYAKSRAGKHARHSRPGRTPTLPFVSTADAWKYFHPSWEESPALFAGKVQEARPGDGIDQYLKFLAGDPKHRIERGFHLPAYLQDRVLFWLSIYARYPSHVRVVHDRDNPGVIYGYIDFAPLLAERISPVILERRAHAIEHVVLEELRHVLGEALGIRKPDTLSRDERYRIIRLTAPLLPKTVAEAERVIHTIRTQTGQSDFFQLALGRGKGLMGEAEGIFRQNHMPLALTRIPFVESSFDIRAHSKAGAIGIWQFTPLAARDVVLRADRKKLWHDTTAQALAASRLLRRYRHSLPDWGTTVTAYNAGVGTMMRLVRHAEARSMKEVLEDPASYRALGFAGRNFYSEFLAVNLIEAYKTQIFIPWLMESRQEEMPGSLKIAARATSYPRMATSPVGATILAGMIPLPPVEW